MSTIGGRALARAGVAAAVVAAALAAMLGPSSEPAEDVAGHWPVQVCTPKVHEPVTINSICVPPG